MIFGTKSRPWNPTKFPQTYQRLADLGRVPRSQVSRVHGEPVFPYLQLAESLFVVLGTPDVNMQQSAGFELIVYQMSS